MRITSPPAIPMSPTLPAPRRPDWWWLRVAAFAVTPVALVSGLAGGLWRMGWDVPGGARLAALHGPLMISALFGTIISLEGRSRSERVGPTWDPSCPRSEPSLCWQVRRPLSAQCSGCRRHSCNRVGPDRARAACCLHRSTAPRCAVVGHRKPPVVDRRGRSVGGRMVDRF
jgi:hypothetical protein